MVLLTTYGMVYEMIRFMAKKVKLAKANFIMINYISCDPHWKQTLRTSYKNCRGDDDLILTPSFGNHLFSN